MNLYCTCSWKGYAKKTIYYSIALLSLQICKDSYPLREESYDILLRTLCNYLTVNMFCGYQTWKSCWSVACAIMEGKTLAGKHTNEFFVA